MQRVVDFPVKARGCCIPMVKDRDPDTTERLNSGTTLNRWGPCKTGRACGTEKLKIISELPWPGVFTELPRMRDQLSAAS